MWVFVVMLGVVMTLLVVIESLERASTHRNEQNYLGHSLPMNGNQLSHMWCFALQQGTPKSPRLHSTLKLCRLIVFVACTLCRCRTFR